MRRLMIFLLTGWALINGLGSPWVRESNTTLRLPDQPGVLGYRFNDALGLIFEAPVAVTTPPGETNRLFIVEQNGQIIVVTNLARPTRTVFLDLAGDTLWGGEQGLLGLAFHPDFARNGRFFVFRTCNARTGGMGSDLRHDRLSEFRVASATSSVASTNEIILIQQADYAPNHNGGDLHFGADGYLYVSLGDEGNANDSLGNSQKITRDFFSGILRLDVDNGSASLEPNPHPAVGAGTYRIPADNPFVGATTFLGRAVDPARVRTEFWAVGLRNPWRMSFDPETDELWVGDVGQNAWESVYVTRRGANHGWAFQEGEMPGPKTNAPSDFLTNPDFNYVGPVYAYGHGSGPRLGSVITGGIVYRGTRLPELNGQYVFADFGSGNVWILKRRAGASPEVTRIAGRGRLAAFGRDPRNGDILACAYSSGQILRLDYEPDFSGTPLPETLAETGAFADLQTLAPNPGVVPYAANLSFWSDGAAKSRWFCVLDTNQFLTFKTNEAFGSPAGTVWIKHFEMELTNGIPASARRLETRFLVRHTNGVYGVTYRWDSLTNATLVPEAGADEWLTRVVDGKSVQQRWHYPSRDECLTCHTAQAGYSLSFNAAQLHRMSTGEPDSASPLAEMIAAGYFENPPTSLRPLRTVTQLTNEAASVEWRARSWLAVNCAPCHRAGITGGGFFDTRLATPTALAGLVNGALNDNDGDPTNRVIVPGDLAHSQLWQRIQRRGPSQMPPLASTVVDPTGVSLVRRWIESLSESSEGEDPELESQLLETGLRLRVNQPANRALILQGADSLANQNWRPLDVPGTEPVFPAESREVEFNLTPKTNRLYRVKVVSP